MFKLPSLFKSADPNLFLAVDISSSAIKCYALELFENDTGPFVEVISVYKKKLEPGIVRGGVLIDIEAISQLLAESVTDITQDIQRPVRQAIFGLSGELCISNVTTVKATRHSQDPVSQKETEEIYQKMLETSQESAQVQLSYLTGNADMDLDLITSSFVYSKLDGKRVVKTLGMDGDILETALFTCFTPTFNVKALQQIAKKAKLKIVSIGSLMYTLTESLKHKFGRHFDGVLLDMGSDLTDVGVVFGGGLVSQKTLPLGGYHFSQEISKKTGLTYFGAEEKKKQYSYSNLTETELVPVQESIEKVSALWVSGLELLFGEFVGVKTFASSVYITGGSAELPEMVDVLSSQPWTKSIPFKSPPEFAKLSINDLIFVRDTTGLCDTLEDIMPLSLSVIFLKMQGMIE